MQQPIEITLRTKNEKQTLSLPFGKNLREGLMEAGLSPYSRKNALLNCRGMGICGTCMVVLYENGERVERRSCQIQCFKPVEIELQ